MYSREQKDYWDKNYLKNSDPNESFFMLYDKLRIKFFRFAANKNPSIEIGAGLGTFARAANVSVAIEISETAAKNALNKCSCQFVLADAVNMPFKANCFGVVYTNDVLHHLKADGLLENSAHEIKRILKPGGLWCLSDRKPCWYNSLILSINRWGRNLFIWGKSLFNHEVLLSGSDNEPPMTKENYATIKENMKICEQYSYRNITVFWIFGFFQFARLIMPKSIAWSISKILANICNLFESLMPASLKTDYCLVLKKEKKNGSF